MPLYVPVAIPAIVTLLFVLCIPWFLWNTLITLEPLNVLIGLLSNVFVGNTSFVNVNVPVDDVSNTAFFNVNFKSSICSGVHVLLLADLNKTPIFGCADTVLFEPITVSPNLAT